MILRHITHPTLLLLFTCIPLYSGNIKEPQPATTYVPTTREKLPIVYRHEYTPNLGTGIMWAAKHLHAFDAYKYQKVYTHLRNQCDIKDKQFHRPKAVSQQKLKQVHDPQYLDRLFNSSEEKANILEVPPLKYLPNWWVNSGILDPMRYATSGTVIAAREALKHGYAINLSGGYHHAEYNLGCGFCALGDIQLAIEELRKEKTDVNVLIVDLDAHQGNGYEEFYVNNHQGYDRKRARIFDMYNKDIFPRRQRVKSVIDQNIELPTREIQPSASDDDNYLDTLQRNFDSYLEELQENGEKPDLIIYNAGTDTYKDDNVGHLNMSHKSIVQRDRYIWDKAYKHNIPIAMILSGGYTPQSAEIIKDSIPKLLKDRGVLQKQT